MQLLAHAVQISVAVIMPTISRFFGIVVFMNYNDHTLPHFHARYQEQEVAMDIATGLVEGIMSRRALNMVLEWEGAARGRAVGELGTGPRTEAFGGNSSPDLGCIHVSSRY